MGRAEITGAISPAKRAAAHDAARSKRFDSSPLGVSVLDVSARDQTDRRRPRAEIARPTAPPVRWQPRRPKSAKATKPAPAVEPRRIEPPRARRVPPAESRVVVGRAGDHPGVYQFMLAVFHGPSREEFHAQQDEPTYEPANRLLIKRGMRVISHLQLIERAIQFGPLQLAVDRAAWLGTLPEFRSQGLAGQLLQAAGRAMAGKGFPLGQLRTRIPHFFHRWGWAVCGRHSRSRAKSRHILARFGGEPAILRRPPLNIRLWRHVELPALMRIYAQNTAGAFGPPVRTEAYWRWLISRKAFDHIIVALDGPDKLELDEATAPIVGYAVIRQQCVVELLTDPAHPAAGQQLLARACADAIERDQNDLVLEAPPGDPLHQLLVAAGGQFSNHAADDQEVYMIRPPDTARLARRLKPLLESRLKESDVARPCELGLLIDNERHLLTISRRGLRITAGRLGRNHITCNRAELTRLMLGHTDPAEAAQHGRLQASSPAALEWAGLLFPRVPLWHPLWDDLPA